MAAEKRSQALQDSLKWVAEDNCVTSDGTLLPQENVIYD